MCNSKPNWPLVSHKSRSHGIEDALPANLSFGISISEFYMEAQTKTGFYCETGSTVLALALATDKRVYIMDFCAVTYML